MRRSKCSTTTINTRVVFNVRSDLSMNVHYLDGKMERPLKYKVKRLLKLWYGDNDREDLLTISKDLLVECLDKLDADAKELARYRYRELQREVMQTKRNQERIERIE